MRMFAEPRSSEGFGGMGPEGMTLSFGATSSTTMSMSEAPGQVGAQPLVVVQAEDPAGRAAFSGRRR
ncbi:MAG: hypothetical protein MZV70_66160 [Desulfobacterales bacterium]|nr:hypothetical protein [Desulfobacterales bacterium]